MQDALEFCEVLRHAPPESQRYFYVYSPSFGSPYDDSIYSLLQKHWRRTNGSGDRADRLSMAIKYKINFDWLIYGLNNNADNTVEYRWTFRSETCRHEKFSDENGLTLSFELFFQSVFLIKHYWVDTGYALCISAAFLKYAKIDLTELLRLYSSVPTFFRGERAVVARKLMLNSLELS
jgi:hypothetical protein